MTPREVALTCAALVDLHWNDSTTMVNQLEQAKRSAARLRDYAATLPDDWVSAEERLPKPFTDVLIYHVLGDQARSPRAYDVAWVNKKGKWVFPWDRNHLPMQRPQWVTHWKPLQAPLAEQRQHANAVRADEIPPSGAAAPSQGEARK
jgi:hypothetical protein